MKQIIYRMYWVWWRLTGYRELTSLLRSHTGNYGALTPVGLERMKELGDKEASISRKMRGIEK